MNAEMLAANLAAHWIQAGVLSLATLCGLRVLGVKEPRLALAAFQIVLVVIVLLPWMQRWRTVEPPPGVPLQAAAMAMVDISTPLPTSAPPQREQTPIDPAMVMLSAIAAGAALRLAWLGAGFIRLRRFARETRCIAPPEFAEGLQERAGAAPQYLEHPTAASPSTFGIFQPRVVLPARFSGL